MRSVDSPWHLAAGVRATVAHRLASGAVLQLWRPGPPPHRDGWYGPGRTFAEAAGLAADDLVFLGRVDGPGGPRWLYRHAGGGEVLVDLAGRPWQAVPCRRSRAGHRLEPIPVAEVLEAIEAPDEAPRRSHPAGAGRWRGSGAAAAAAPVAPGPRPEPTLAAVLPFRPRSG